MLSADPSPSGPPDAATSSSFTIAVAEVTSATDTLACGRVQIQVPWLQDVQPWARVALPGAGSGRGTYALPHPGDEVLVAFNRNDVTDCYVIGGLWNASDPPPLRGPLDPTTRMALRSEQGNEVDMDDVGQTITVTTSTGMTIELGPSGIKLSTAGDAATIEATREGDLTLSASKSISLTAPEITLDGTGKVSVSSSGSVSVDGGTSCSIQAATISLN